MFLLITVRVKNAVFYLVNSFLNGFGTVKSEFLTSLTISIGLKLGDEDIIELMSGEKPVSKDIQKCADKCVSKIVKNAKEIGNKTHLTYEELIGYSKDFDQLVKSSGYSYYENIPAATMRYLSNFVELDDNINGSSSDVVISGSIDSSCNCIII